MKMQTASRVQPLANFGEFIFPTPAVIDWTTFLNNLTPSFRIYQMKNLYS